MKTHAYSALKLWATFAGQMRRPVSMWLKPRESLSKGIGLDSTEIEFSSSIVASLTLYVSEVRDRLNPLAI